MHRNASLILCQKRKQTKNKQKDEGKRVESRGREKKKKKRQTERKEERKKNCSIFLILSSVPVLGVFSSL